MEFLLLPKRLHTFSKILAISALSSCIPVMAQEKNAWQYDSLGKSDATKPDAQRVYEVLLKMLDRWNAHDIEGHLELYWNSPELLVVVDSEQFNGWQQLHDSYVNGYPDRSAMGFIEPGRIQVRLLSIRVTKHTADHAARFGGMHSGFDPLRWNQRRTGSNSGATSTSMLRATPGCRRTNPARSRVSTIW